MRLYNTLSRQLEELPPPDAGPVRMYFCGPTVYQRAHIGNARPFLLGMWLRDWLRYRGYDATLVHNITDVNDKIYDAAPGASAELAARATQWYLEDIGDFGLGLPDALPKATEHIPGIVRFIEELIAHGNAYAVDGDVYFRVASDPGLRPACRASGPIRWRSRSRTCSRRIRATSRSGRRTSPARTPRGTRRGAAGGPAGTSSAR